MLINEAVLHILDKNSGNLLLSQAPLQLGDPFLIEYITKLVDKIKKGDPHIGQLASSEPLLGYLADEGISFLEKTQQLSDKLFALIAPAEEIGPADYLFFTGNKRYRRHTVWNDSPRLQFKSHSLCRLRR